AKNGGKAWVDITFRTYLEPEQFRTWASKMGLHVMRAELRTVDAQGMSGTLGITTPPASTDPLPQKSLDEGLLAVRKHPGLRTIRGVIYTMADVDATQLPAIAADPLVFLADVTPTYVYNKLVALGWTGVDYNRIGGIPTHPFPVIESFGLENFQK